MPGAAARPCPAGHLIAFYGFKISVASHLLQGAACYAFELNKQREGGLLFFPLVFLPCILAVLFCIFSRRHFAIKMSDSRIHATPTKKKKKIKRGKGGGRKSRKRHPFAEDSLFVFFSLCCGVKNSFAGRPSWPSVGTASSVGTPPLASEMPAGIPTAARPVWCVRRTRVGRASVCRGLGALSGLGCHPR